MRKRKDEIGREGKEKWCSYKRKIAMEGSEAEGRKIRLREEVKRW